jgi:argininosuccinate lyase
MLQSAQSGFMNAWAAATYLVQRGVPSRLAHEKIGKAVQICLERNCELQELPLDDLQSLSPVFNDDFYEALKLESVLAIHNVPGGTAPSRVREAINIARNKIAALREEVHAPETHAPETHALETHAHA